MDGATASSLWPELCVSSSRIEDLLSLVLPNVTPNKWIEWRADLLGAAVPSAFDPSHLLWTWRVETVQIKPQAPTTDLELCPLPLVAIALPSVSAALPAKIHGLTPSQLLVRSSAMARALSLYGLVDMQLGLDNAFARSLRPLSAKRVVLSYHGFFEGLATLKRVVRQMREYPHMRYWKIAIDFSQKGGAEAIGECLNWLRSLGEPWSSKIIFIPMGERFSAWRLLSSYYLSPFLFCAAHLSSATAKGQLGLDSLRYLPRHQRSESIFALVGNPVHHSISHLSHNWLFQQLQIRASYLKFVLEGEELKGWLKQAHQWGVQGLSVTMPHKERAFELAYSATPQALRARAANTLTWHPEGWMADNTDVKAFEEIFRELKISSQSSILIVGAGATARAALAAYLELNALGSSSYLANSSGMSLTDLGAQIFLTNRSIERALKLKAETGVELIEASELTASRLAEFDLIIQTSAQTTEYPFNPEDLSPHTQIIELVNGALTQEGEAVSYKPTTLIEQATVCGCRCIDAQSFFFRQAAYQFESWLKIQPEYAYFLLQSAKLESPKYDPLVSTTDS